MSRNTRGTSSSILNLSHPSVRIKGTENDFNPLNCVDHRCKHNTVVHLHCPFCVKTETFYDERILKVHYGVKHVDKGIEFAGLKILRCCEHCDMVGVIKGEKRFKSAHWHCFKCRNGFSRRDEAVKHYRTHFREPYSTFQIYIAQEVNNLMGYQECRTEDLDPLQDRISDYVAKETGSAVATREVLGTPVILKGSENTLFGDSFDGHPDLSNSALVVENQNSETENQPAIVIIQPDQELLSSQTLEHAEATESQEKVHLEKLVNKLQEDIIQLTAKKESAEIKLKAEIQNLKNKVKSQADELEQLNQKLTEKSVHAENNQDTSEKMASLIAALKEQHAQLLTEQLHQIKKEALSSIIQDMKEKVFPDSSNVSLDSESYLLPGSVEQQNFTVHTDSSRFIIEKSGSVCNTGLSRPYFVVSQGLNNVQKRKYEEVQEEEEEEEPLLSKE